MDNSTKSGGDVSPEAKPETGDSPTKPGAEQIAGDGADKGKGKGKGKPPMTFDYIKTHMNEDHADSLLAYAIFYAGKAGAVKAVLTDVNLDAFFVSVELADGSRQDVTIPYEGGSIESIDGIGKVMVVMSKKSRDEVFVTCAEGVTEKVSFAPFNDRNKEFKDKCAAKDFVGLAAMYTTDAVLKPQTEKDPLPILANQDSIRSFFESNGEKLLNGITLKPLRLSQKSDVEVTETGRAWGNPGRPYCRQWMRVGESWLLQNDELPV